MCHLTLTLVMTHVSCALTSSSNKSNAINWFFAKQSVLLTDLSVCKNYMQKLADHDGGNQWTVNEISSTKREF